MTESTAIARVPGMGAIAGLRSATWPSHQRLEKRLGVKRRFSNLAAYRAHLEKMWGFCAGLEQSLGPASFGGALPDYAARRKLPLLTQDLVALGADVDSVSLLARCPLSCRADPAHAFGCAYVIEGATLGGRTLLPFVHEHLGFTADHGAAFLASYRANVPAMWLDFCAALEGWCSLPERRRCAIAAAVDTFDSLTAWLCGEPL